MREERVGTVREEKYKLFQFDYGSSDYCLVAVSTDTKILRSCIEKIIEIEYTSPNDFLIEPA